VRVAARQLRDTSFANFVDQILRDEQVAPSSLQIEISESAVVERDPTTLASLTRMRRTGMGIAVAGFGTGASSMSYLRDLPVDTLKIDQAFVKEIGNDRFTRSITAAIVNLAHALGMHVVAEGIETPEQMRVVRLLRCDLWQGRHLSEPLPAAELESFLALRSRVKALKRA
jgi:EAL domain-containing protein (putative c-di-GMP-specific phosphodiesterase class I)